MMRHHRLMSATAAWPRMRSHATSNTRTSLHAISRHVKHAYLRPRRPGCALQPPTKRRHHMHQGQPLHVLQPHSHSSTCLREHASARCHQRHFWQLGSQRWQLLMPPCLQIHRSLRSHRHQKAPNGCFLAAPCAMISFCAALHATNASPTERVTNWQAAIAYCNMITPQECNTPPALWVHTVSGAANHTCFSSSYRRLCCRVQSIKHSAVPGSRPAMLTDSAHPCTQR